MDGDAHWIMQLDAGSRTAVAAVDATDLKSVALSNRCEGSSPSAGTATQAPPSSMADGAVVIGRNRIGL